MMDARKSEEPKRKRGAAHDELRRQTRQDHESVDTAFAGYDLETVEGYRGFLLAHARVLPQLEATIDPAALLESWIGRTSPLLADLDALQMKVPPAIPVVLPTPGARWGALYVLEGSRLGGAFLARQVGGQFPKAFLSAVHGPGRWQQILSALDRANCGGDWVDHAVVGARSVFDAYRRAAASGQVDP